MANGKRQIEFQIVAPNLPSEICNLRSAICNSQCYNSVVFLYTMSDSLRTDRTRASDADRDAKIEQLLLVGLDHYFAAQYDQAINVWTRALFLDRSHARARAYIERARSALAERLRQSEELLQSGVSAFERGEGDEARRLLRAAIDGGAPADEALAVLDRLDQREATAMSEPPAKSRKARPRPVSPANGPARSSLTRWLAALVALAVLAAGGYAASIRGRVDWRSLIIMTNAAPAANVPVAGDTELPLPRRGETALMRARALAASGHLRDALASLDLVRGTDPQKVEADRLRVDIQRQLLSLAEPATPAPQTDIEKGNPRVP